MREHGRSRRRLSSEILNLLCGGGIDRIRRPKNSVGIGGGDTWHSNAHDHDYRDVANLTIIRSSVRLSASAMIVASSTRRIPAMLLFTTCQSDDIHSFY
jgi:hypothetical protein